MTRTWDRSAIELVDQKEKRLPTSIQNTDSLKSLARRVFRFSFTIIRSRIPFMGDDQSTSVKPFHLLLSFGMLVVKVTPMGSRNIPVIWNPCEWTYLHSAKHWIVGNVDKGSNRLFLSW